MREMGVSMGTIASISPGLPWFGVDSEALHKM
jgi:hypothetical protein